MSLDRAKAVECAVASLSARYYTDERYYANERREIFAKEWICIGFEHQLERANDTVTEIIAGSPVFVQRGRDGTLRGFHNVCPHRAGPIVTDDYPSPANLVCRYHGWAYDEQGALLNARDFGAPVPADTCLTPISVGVWRSVVFVNLDPNARPLVEWLGRWPDEMAQWTLEGCRFHSRSVREMQCNWKTYGDNFLEGYHVPLVHNGLARQTDSLRYRVWNHGDRRWNVHLTPHPDDALVPGTFMCFWPNFSMDIFAGGWCTERWLPRGPYRTDLIFDYFFADDADNIEGTVKVSEAVADEDALMVQLVQRNLDAGHYDRGLLSPRHENGLIDWQELYLEVLKSGGPAVAVGPYPPRNPTS
jgi:choline monooxygenase